MGTKRQKEIYPSKEKKGMKIFGNVNYLDYLYNIIKQQLNNRTMKNETLYYISSIGLILYYALFIGLIIFSPTKLTDNALALAIVINVTLLIPFLTNKN